MFKHILISTDGSKLAGKGIKAGLKLAAAQGAKVTVYRAVQDHGAYIEGGYALPKELKARLGRDVLATAKADMDGVRKQAQAANIACNTVITRNVAPWKGIADTAHAKGCDVIVMASHGRGGLATAMLGSVTQKVLAQSRLPVLVCR